MGRVILCILLFFLAYGPSLVHAQPPDKAESSSSKSDKDDLTQKLAKAKSGAQGQHIADALEALRANTLQPATRALLRAAERHIQASKLASALDDINSASALQPDNAYLLRQRAQINALAGQSQAALVDLAHSIHLDENDVQAWDLLSSVEEQKGDMVAAYKAWKHALTLYPGLTDGAQRLKKLYTKAYGQQL